MARSALRWTLDELVEVSGVGRNTVRRFENEYKVTPVTAVRLRVAFEKHGVRFVDFGPHSGAVHYAPLVEGSPADPLQENESLPD
jgi:transcriptional regulator with XRE-family HTH domain